MTPGLSRSVVLSLSLQLTLSQDLHNALSRRLVDFLSIFANEHSMRLPVFAKIHRVSEVAHEFEVDRGGADPTNAERW